MKNNLIEKSPEKYFDSIHNELNHFFRDVFLSNSLVNSLTVPNDFTWRPAIEVKQTEKNYKVKVQLPGIKKEDINVELDNDFMTITAETKEEQEEKTQEEENEKCHTSEFHYGRYQRTISFDKPIKVNDSSAEYKNGILTIIVPKQIVEETKMKKLEIKG